MYKILEDLGLKNNGVEVYRLEELGLVAANTDTWNGISMEAWECDKCGFALDPEASSFRLARVYKPVAYDEETGEPVDWEQIGFELD